MYTPQQLHLIADTARTARAQRLTASVEKFTTLIERDAVDAAKNGEFTLVYNLGFEYIDLGVELAKHFSAFGGRYDAGIVLTRPKYSKKPHPKAVTTVTLTW